MLQGQKKEQRENSVSGSSRRRKRKSNLKEEKETSGRSSSSSRRALRGNNVETAETGNGNSDANGSNNIFDSATLWLKPFVTRSNHSRTGSRSGRRSSRNGSRSSHGSIISAQSMASSMDSGTDADLDYEILSDDENDDVYDREDEEVLTETDTESEDEKSQKDLHNNTAESTEPVGKLSPNMSGDDETLTKSSSPVSALSTKELRFASLPEHLPTNNVQGDEMPLSKKKTNKIQTGGILRNGFGNPKNKQTKFGKGEGKLRFGKIGRNSEASKQVLWASELKEEYSHHSKDKVQKETVQDYAMPLKQLPTNSKKRHSTDAFFSLLKSAENARINSRTNKRGSFSSESVYSLNSSNRQDSLADINDLESFRRRSSLNASAASLVSQMSQIIDSSHGRGDIEITTMPLSNHEEVITIPLAGEKPSKVNWQEVNKKLQNRQRLDEVAMENGMCQRDSFESDMDLSADFYDPFFAPREERKSASSIDLPKKSILKNDGDEARTMTLNSSLDSNAMEYSFSIHNGEDTTMESTQEDKSNQSSSTNSMLRKAAPWVFAFSAVLTAVLLLYFLLRPSAVEEDQIREVDSLFVAEP